MSDRPNLPLPDQLNAVRQQIKQLEEREGELRRQILQHPELRTGHEWLAEIKTTQVRRTDWKEIAALHPGLVEEHTFSLPVERVVLSGIDQETGEIIGARQFRKAQSKD